MSEHGNELTRAILILIQACSVDGSRGSLDLAMDEVSLNGKDVGNWRVTVTPAEKPGPCIPRDGEPFFTLLGRDAAAPDAIEKWAGQRSQQFPWDHASDQEREKERKKIDAAYAMANEMRVYRRTMKEPVTRADLMRASAEVRKFYDGGALGDPYQAARAYNGPNNPVNAKMEEAAEAVERDEDIRVFDDAARFQNYVSDLRAVLLSIGDEVAKARAKHKPMNSAHEGYAVIHEELDELWDEVKADRGYQNSGFTEAIQTGAMCVRYILDLSGKK